MFFLFLFFFNDPATTEIYTLSLHDALPILDRIRRLVRVDQKPIGRTPRSNLATYTGLFGRSASGRSEEHTSELQSHVNLVCRLLLEKKKKNAICHTLR